MNKGQFKKGQIPANKGIGWKNEIRICLNCRNKFNPAKKNSQFCSKGCASSYRQKGTTKSISTRINMSLAKTKEKNFTGFKTRRKKSTITSYEYNNWRKAVFVRDSFTCQICRCVGVYLEAHHIKSFAKFPDLRLEISNGVTLCKKCHMNVDKQRKKFGKNGGD